MRARSEMVPGIAGNSGFRFLRDGAITGGTGKTLIKFRSKNAAAYSYDDIAFLSSAPNCASAAIQTDDAILPPAVLITAAAKSTVQFE